MNKKTGMINKKSFYTPQNIKFESNYFGVKKDSLELNIWVYEIICQLQSLSGESFVLKGGGASQLYIPLDYQRCTLDIDMLCTASEDEITGILSQIKKDFISQGIPCSFEKYIPKMPRDMFHVIPMVTYLLYLPFRYHKHKKSDLKIDFIFGDVSKVETTLVHNPSVMGLDIEFSPRCVSKNTLISEKLLTFAANSIGLQEYKIDGFYKNLYDLYYLINIDTSVDSFIAVSQYILKSMNFECDLKSLAELSSMEILEDMLMTLLKLFTWDLREQKSSLHRKVKRFMESSLQRNIRQSLSIDMWSIMAMNIYVYVYSLIGYLQDKSIESLEIINKYIEKSESFDQIQKSEKKALREMLLSKIHNWNKDIVIDYTTGIYRLIFLELLIDEGLI